MLHNEPAEHKLENLVHVIYEKIHEFTMEQITIKPKEYTDTFSI